MVEKRLESSRNREKECDKTFHIKIPSEGIERKRVRERHPLYLESLSFVLTIASRIAIRRRVHRIRAAACASAQRPARLSDPWSPSWKHSPVVIVVSPPSLRAPRIEAISSVARAGKSVRVHAARSSESPSLSLAARRTARWKYARWRLLYSVGDFACRAKCAAIEIIKRERASATREKETGDSLFLLTVLLCAGCIRESAIRIRLPLLKCLAQIPTPCCASVATRLRVGKWVVISRCAITPLSRRAIARRKKNQIAKMT